MGVLQDRERVLEVDGAVMLQFFHVALGVHDALDQGKHLIALLREQLVLSVAFPLCCRFLDQFLHVVDSDLEALVDLLDVLHPLQLRFCSVRRQQLRTDPALITLISGCVVVVCVLGLSAGEREVLA